MAYRTITVFIVDPEAAEATLDAALEIAAGGKIHLEVFCLGVELTQPQFYYTGSPLVLMPGAIEEAAGRAEALEATARERLEGKGVPFSIVATATSVVGVQSTVAEAARFSDLVVAVAPYAEGRSVTMAHVVEAVLFATEVPVLIVPNGLPAQFSRAVVAWNDSPEALAAARAGLPLLREAKTVEIVSVGSTSRWAERSDGAQRLQQLLARHRVEASIVTLEKTRAPVGEILGDYLKETGTKLMVMGAYGRSRLREAIMGGATRDTLEKTSIPVLMAH